MAHHLGRGECDIRNVWFISKDWSLDTGRAGGDLADHIWWTVDVRAGVSMASMTRVSVGSLVGVSVTSMVMARMAGADSFAS